MRASDIIIQMILYFPIENSCRSSDEVKLEWKSLKLLLFLAILSSKGLHSVKTSLYPTLDSAKTRKRMDCGFDYLPTFYNNFMLLQRF